MRRHLTQDDHNQYRRGPVGEDVGNSCHDHDSFLAAVVGGGHTDHPWAVPLGVEEGSHASEAEAPLAAGLK